MRVSKHNKVMRVELAFVYLAALPCLYPSMMRCQPLVCTQSSTPSLLPRSLQQVAQEHSETCVCHYVIYLSLKVSLA
jgi:hypothetical protein